MTEYVYYIVESNELLILDTLVNWKNGETKKARLYIGDATLGKIGINLGFVTYLGEL